MHPRAPRRWRLLLPALAGVATLACSGARAQRNAPVPRLDLFSPDDPSAPDTGAPGEDAEGEHSGYGCIGYGESYCGASFRKSQAEWTDSVTEDALSELPDAPQPQNGGQSIDRSQQKSMTPGFPPVSPTPGLSLPRSPEQHPGIPSQPSACMAGISMEAQKNISCAPRVNYFQRFVDSADIHPLTARQKGVLALRNTTDPYNFATIAVVSGISVASDPHSAYGPGFPGFGRNFGVAYCETAIGEFFGTFLIPAIAHQDPHYHRMPNASYARRTLHAITAVAVAQSDYGAPMPNYANLVTTGIGDGLGNLYVPGRQTDWGSSVARYATSIATDPINNFVSEFLPDVARRVNVRIVLVQRVIDQVERQNGASAP